MPFWCCFGDKSEKRAPTTSGPSNKLEYGEPRSFQNVQEHLKQPAPEHTHGNGVNERATYDVDSRRRSTEPLQQRVGGHMLFVDDHDGGHHHRKRSSLETLQQSGSFEQRVPLTKATTNLSTSSGPANQPDSRRGNSRKHSHSSPPLGAYDSGQMPCHSPRSHAQFYLENVQKQRHMTVSKDPVSLRRTFRPAVAHRRNVQSRYAKLIRDTMSTASDLSDVVSLPRGEDQNEWIATNTVVFFNTVSLIYGEVCTYCTAESCPRMTCGPKYEYLWADNKRIKSPIKVCAPEYITLLMCWVENIFNDRRIFPVADGQPFPSDFQHYVRKIHKRLFRVYAHMYHSHFRDIESLDLSSHLNHEFKHFIVFSYEFGLVTHDETAPLHDLIDMMRIRTDPSES